MFRDRRGWLATGLLLSIALNLFLGGILSGRWFSSFDPVREAAARAPSFVARFRALPAEEQAHFNAAYEPHRAAVVDARQALRAARLRALGTLGAPIYDPVLMQQSFDAVRQATQAAQIAVQAALIDGFVTLSPQARATLEGVERPLSP